MNKVDQKHETEIEDAASKEIGEELRYYNSLPNLMRAHVLRSKAGEHSGKRRPPRNGAPISPWKTLDPTKNLKGGGGG